MTWFLPQRVFLCGVLISIKLKYSKAEGILKKEIEEQ